VTWLEVVGVAPPNAYLRLEGLDAWAKDTNGTPFSQETKDKLVNSSSYQRKFILSILLSIS
jgi:hypothetical protein